MQPWLRSSHTGLTLDARCERGLGEVISACFRMTPDKKKFQLWINSTEASESRVHCSSFLLMTELRLNRMFLKRKTDNVCRARRVLWISAVAWQWHCQGVVFYLWWSPVVEPGLSDEPSCNPFSCMWPVCSLCMCVHTCVWLFYSSQAAMYLTVRPSKEHADCMRWQSAACEG